MPVLVSQLIKERTKYLKGLKPKAREVDSAIESFERELIRIIQRKKALPEEEDLKRLLSLLGVVANKLSIASRYLEKGYVQ